MSQRGTTGDYLNTEGSVMKRFSKNVILDAIDISTEHSCISFKFWMGVGIIMALVMLLVVLERNGGISIPSVLFGALYTTLYFQTDRRLRELRR